MNRREFLTKTTIALSGISILSLAKKSFAQEQCAPGKCVINTQISNNHNHEAIIPLEDVMLGKTKTYNIQGHSSHPHTIEVTEDHFAQLRTSKVVDIVSTNDFGHSHTVRLIREILELS